MNEMRRFHNLSQGGIELGSYFINAKLTTPKVKQSLEVTAPSVGKRAIAKHHDGGELRKIRWLCQLRSKGLKSARQGGFAATFTPLCPPFSVERQISFERRSRRWQGHLVFDYPKPLLSRQLWHIQ
eukprot:TRINITY_DN11473_c0_g2_i1.p1 TRINITY_DN11473_c0_g2~~TRINITY_DN11473_c0_g2_i1.p1  ORF type:complete len:126 (-),score=10.84 TRINITY_DN11473_c0_g2_i1:60-437(-)